ncbi:GNAT family N-acetyltransferase [Leptolyngbya sp. FACHB-8]|uniref:GNAT family N-acetyltransferase n=1 Tax=unclassified Leptolyngbya TaxID=2650499 RepID=UPI001686E1E4|nr:GNAT family N-acetyltransferase [Leptolyngbya sp. FACHB-8]MBD1909487.1 GNAT family N-acetyltransferase [Leptolyngbya sp. FACHB-8]
MQIRSALPSDSTTIAELLTSLDYPGTEAFIDTRIKQLLSHPDAVLLVAAEGSAVLGFVSLHFIPQIALEGDFCRISYFCVAETARSQGIGAMLEAEITAQAQQRRCDRIEVHCHSRREAAHRFYHRQGYTESPKYLMKSLKETY